MPSEKRTNIVLSGILSILGLYIAIVIINLIKIQPSYKPQTLGDQTAVLPSSTPVPTAIPLILSVNVQNTKAMPNLTDIFETDILIKTSSNSSVGFWYQGPNNPYGTSVVEEKTVALKTDHTFHISALPKGIYEFFAAGFLNQAQKPPYEQSPSTGTSLMYIGVPTPTPLATTTALPSSGSATIKNVQVSNPQSDSSNSGTSTATLTFTTSLNTQATVVLVGPSAPDGKTISTPKDALTQNQSIKLTGLYKGSYTYYILVNTNPSNSNSTPTRYPQTGTATFEVK